MDFCLPALDSLQKQERDNGVTTPVVLHCKSEADIYACNASCVFGSKVRGFFVCNLPNGFYSSVDLACIIATTADDASSSDPATTGPVIGGIAGGVFACTVAVALLLIYLRSRQQKLKSGELGSEMKIRGSAFQQLEQLLVVKVEQLFSLAFAGHFTAEQLAIATAAFATLEVPRKCIKLDRVVGQGQSGDVFVGKLALPKQKAAATVAVKMYKANRDDTVSGSDMAGEEALQLEARLLHQLQHPHIVQVLAVVTQSLPTLVCLEYMQNGDLKTYLRSVFLLCIF